MLVLLTWVQAPGSRVFSPRNVRLKISLACYFWDPLNFLFMSEKESESLSFFVTKGSRTLSCALEPEASTTKSPSNGLTFRWVVCSIDQLWYLCTWLSFSLYADQLWNTTGMEPSPPPCSSWACGPRGAGSLGRLGAPSNLLPNTTSRLTARWIELNPNLWLWVFYHPCCECFAIPHYGKKHR